MDYYFYMLWKKFTSWLVLETLSLKKTSASKFKFENFL